MKVLQPVDFENSMLVSTTATEIYPTYSSSTTYTLGAIVQFGTSLYESLAFSNINNQPDVPNSNFWLRLRSDNRRSMFDRSITNGTSAGSSLEVVLFPNKIIDSIALINLDSELAVIEIRDGAGGPIVYQRTIGLNDVNITDWYQYFFFDPLLKRTQVVLTDIPPYINARIRLTLSKTSGNVSIGEMIFGRLEKLGATQYGANAGIVDYSRKETDEFGNISFVERPFSKRLSCEFYLENAQLNRVQQVMYSLRAKPSVWIASDVPTFEEAMIIYGFYRDFSLQIAYPNHSLYNIEIEGLT